MKRNLKMNLLCRKVEELEENMNNGMDMEKSGFDRLKNHHL